MRYPCYKSYEVIMNGDRGNFFINMLCEVSELLDILGIWAFGHLTCSEIGDVGHDKMDQRWLFERQMRDRNCEQIKDGESYDNRSNGKVFILICTG
jgi:hypothetical protein